MGILDWFVSENEKQRRRNYNEAVELAIARAKQPDTRSIEQVVAEQNAKFAAMNARTMETSSLLGGNFGLVGGVVPARPKLATDLPITRVADLAGYLGRVHEQLSFAAIAVAPYEDDPEKTKKTELTLRLRDAAEKAAKVQLDLLEIIQQEREEEAARAIEAQERVSSQWTTDELDRMMREGAPPIVPNRIKPMPEPDAHDRGGFEGS